MQRGQYTMGEKVKAFEQAYADYCGTKYCVAVNSGSSANLLMVAAHTLRHGKGTVIVPAVGWATSYSPFQQYGWQMIFVDIDRKTLNYDVGAVEGGGARSISRMRSWRSTCWATRTSLTSSPTASRCWRTTANRWAPSTWAGCAVRSARWARTARSSRTTSARWKAG